MSRVPRIRFKGFKEDWEQRKLGDIFIYLRNNTLSREELNDEDGFAQSIHYGDVLIKYGECLNVSKGLLPYIDNKNIVNKFKKFYIQNGDVIIADTAEDETVGKCIEISGIVDHNIISGLHTIPLRPVNKFAYGYLGFYLNSNSYHNQLKPLMQGIKVRSISKNLLKTTTLNYPSNTQEQKIIGIYFDALNHLITLHQRKFEKLKIIKKSMLENLFPQNGEKTPKIRFSGFTKDWEQRKLGEVFEEYSEKNRSELPPLTIIQGGGTIRRDESDRALQYDKGSLSNYKVVNKGDFIVHLRSFEGGLEKANSTGIVSPAYHTLSGENTDTTFYYAYFRSRKFIESDLKPHVYGIRDGRSIDIEGMKTINIPYTIFDEQRRIGKFIDLIDHLITLHQRKFEKLKIIKKSMLENLFPQNGEKTPKIRFSGFTKDWEQRKLGEVFEEYSEKNRSELPPLTIIQGGGTIRRDESDRALQYDKGSLSNYKVVNKGDFIVHLRSFEGGLEKANSTGIVSPAYHTLSGENTDTTFYYAYFRSRKFIESDLKPHVYGIRDGRSIDIEGMKTINIPYTIFDEQRRIGKFIDLIDHLITLHQSKLEKLQKIKKSMLESMFV